MVNDDVISMPDKWEYPWYAAWDLAFHCVALAAVDSRLRQAAARPDAARALPAPERPDPGLRVELRRREPARARLGDALHLPQREGSRRGSGDLDFLKRAFQKLLVNFTWWVNRKDPHRQERLRGRLPRPRQHRRLRPQRAAADRRLRSSRPTAPPGWRSSARTCCEIALELALRRSHLRGHGAQVRRALPLDRRPRWTASASSTTRCGTRRTASSTTCCACPTAARRGSRCARWSACCRCARPPSSRSDFASRFPRVVEGAERFLERYPELLEHVARPDELGRARPAPARRPRPRQAAPASWRACSTRTSSSSPHGIRSLSRYHLEHPFVFRVRRSGLPRRVPAGRVELGAVRRQLELARADLVPDQRPDHPRAAAVLLVLRRRLHRRVPDRLGQDDDRCSRSRARSPTG